MKKKYQYIAIGSNFSATATHDYEGTERGVKIAAKKLAKANSFRQYRIKDMTEPQHYESIKTYEI